MDAERQAYMRSRVELLHESIFMKNEAELEAFLLNYDKANRELVAELHSLYVKFGRDGGLSYSDMQKYGRFKKLSKQLDGIVKTLGKTEEKFIAERVSEVWGAAAEGLSGALGIDFVAIPRSRVEKVMSYPWSGATFSDRVWENKRRLVTKLREILTRGMIQGQGVSQMTKAVQDAMKVEAYVARRLVRTEAMFFMNQSQLDQYAALGVEQVEYIAAFDERTCNICAPDDTKVFTRGQEIALPRHPNCRCTYIPVVTGADNWSRFEPIGGKA